MWIDKIIELCAPKTKLRQENMLNAVQDIAKNVEIMKDNNLRRLARVESYKKELAELKAKREEEQRLFVSVLDHLDDMVWAKDIDGKYIMANKAFREKFCYGMEWDELRGRTDVEIARIFKDKVGDENHTFGEVCANSDEVIMKTNQAREFLEYGNIDGKLVKLIVNKSPVFNKDGVMFAICGSGRNVTWLHDKLEKALNHCSGCKGTEPHDLMEQLFKDIKFEEGDRARDGMQSTGI